jgi:diguanylate cyclase (GGDEF)-like protein
VSDRADTDALTGLHNRGAFDARIRSLVANSSAHPSALIMIDLDGFKDYNDRHGHPEGDRALQGVSDAICSAVRDRDQAFRYGGDEFAIVLPRADVEPAVQVADRVRVAISTLKLVEPGALTASAGVACLAIHANTAKTLIAAADAALYRAKASGGDRTEVGGRHDR